MTLEDLKTPKDLQQAVHVDYVKIRGDCYVA